VTKAVIKVAQLSKRYRLGLKEKQAETLIGQISQAIRSPWENLKRLRQLSRFGEQDESVFWALKDISFEVKEGEVLGIIGKNGAGKSTLLKILSQITEPTSGKIEIHGRVASLLEVGTGFHPELSGRENIYMNGTILGMTRREIDSKLDEIIDFSGVEKFIDTPVKFYSSGMKVRLGFSVAAHLDPEILIIDEVLAVGDFEFQKKCLGKMEDVSRNQGRTVLFVSHNLDAVEQLCQKSILLKNGFISSLGNTSDVLTNYIREEIKSKSQIFYSAENSPSDDFVSLISCEVIDVFGVNKSYFQINQSIGIRIKFKVVTEHDNLTLGFNLYSEKDLHILTSHQPLNDNYLGIGEFQAIVWIPSNLLTSGLYYCGIACISYNPFHVHFHDIKKISFTILDILDKDTARGINYNGFLPGIVRPILNWEVI
jgi:lipopolysaccharide transport system ATP-binding protein